MRKVCGEFDRWLTEKEAAEKQERKVGKPIEDITAHLEIAAVSDAGKSVEGTVCVGDYSVHALPNLEN